MINALFANIQKELLLLRRDLVGLSVIFLMPVVLVVVVTLVQQNVAASMGETKIKAIFLDRDGQALGQKIEDAMNKSGALTMVKDLDGKAIDEETAKKAIAKGDLQFAVIIPEGTASAFIDRARQSAKNSISVGGEEGNNTTDEPVKVPDLLVYFDPNVREDIRAGIISSLEKIILSIDIDEKMKTFSSQLPTEIEAAARKAMGPMWQDQFKIPGIRITWDKTPGIKITEKTAQYNDTAKMPTTVQQNVPAWTIFGMFFIVVPLGGSILRERQGEMLVRLLTLPQSCITILAGKIISFVLICALQFFLIMLIGKFVLPLLGAPVLDMGSSPPALVLIALSVSLAACGYGILLGTMARTYEQASTFGAVSVVIAAAIGGIMVPSYVMPRLMQEISVFSPLSWGLNAFLDVFVRGGDIVTVLPDVALLLIFFLITSLVAWFNLSNKGRIRIR
jgi:ABC-2 type transport system permease protein